MILPILVEGSATSSAARDFIASRAACLGGRPELQRLNVQLPIPPRAAGAAGRELVRSCHQAEAEAFLDPAQKRLVAAGLKAKVPYVVGVEVHSFCYPRPQFLLDGVNQHDGALTHQNCYRC